MFETGSKPQTMSVSLSDKGFVEPVDPSLENQKNVREILRTGSLLAVGLCSLGVMLVYLRFILVPLVLSRLFVFTLEPVVWFLENGSQLGTAKIWRYCLAPFRFPHWMSVICTILFGLFSSALMVVFLSASVQQLSQVSHPLLFTLIVVLSNQENQIKKAQMNLAIISLLLFLSPLTHQFFPGIRQVPGANPELYFDCESVRCQQRFQA